MRLGQRGRQNRHLRVQDKEAVVAELRAAQAEHVHRVTNLQCPGRLKQEPLCRVFKNFLDLNFEL